jgi:hypothetical protein
MDEAWAQFATQPPTRMKVQVADGPGDARRRKLVRAHPIEANNLPVGTIRDLSFVLMGPMLFLIFMATFVLFATMYAD